MSEQRTSQPPPAPGPVGWLFILAGRLTGLIIAALLLRLAIELMGLYFWWPQEETRHILQVITREQAELLLHLQPHPFGNQLQALLNDGRESVLSFRRRIDIYYLQVPLDALAYSLTSFLLRLVWLAAMLPLLDLCVFTGLVEGLVQRDLRRFGTGLESTFIYRHARRIGGSVTATWLIFWLIQPFCLPATLILPITTIWAGIIVWIVAYSFKRWL